MANLCLTLVLGMAVFVMMAHGQKQRQKLQAVDCDECERTACPKVSEDACPAGLLQDECGCCQVCAKKLGQSCGGKLWASGRCGRDYYCMGPRPEKAINIVRGEVGACKCREDRRTCGNDGIVYDNVCVLKETSHEQRQNGGSKIEVSTDRKICRSEPTLILNTPTNSSSTVKTAGDQTYLQCVGEGFPAPFITWTKDGDILPGDHLNIAAQTIGGPRENQATGWLLISPVSAVDAGEYTCEATNGIGQVLRATALLVVTEP